MSRPLEYIRVLTMVHGRLVEIAAVQEQPNLHPDEVERRRQRFAKIRKWLRR